MNHKILSIILGLLLFTGTSFADRNILTQKITGNNVSGDSTGNQVGNNTPFSPTSSLNTSLIAFWRLGEASGTRVDSVGSNDLTDNNTVTQTTGVINNAGQFTRSNNEYLSIADNTDLSTGDIDFSISAWVYFDTNTSSMYIATKFTATGNQREFTVGFYQPFDRIRAGVSTDGSDDVSLNADNLGSPSTATWYHIVFWHDATANTINLVVNDGSVDSVSHSGGVFDSTADFDIGTLISSADAWDGRIDAVGFWKKVLSSAERTELYNSGNGMEHPF